MLSAKQEIYSQWRDVCVLDVNFRTLSKIDSNSKYKSLTNGTNCKARSNCHGTNEQVCLLVLADWCTGNNSTKKKSAYFIGTKIHIINMYVRDRLQVRDLHACTNNKKYTDRSNACAVPHAEEKKGLAKP